MVELIMHVSRSEDNRLSGTVRLGRTAEGHSFSGVLELMRVFEELVPADLGAGVSESVGRGDGRPPGRDGGRRREPKSHSSEER